MWGTAGPQQRDPAVLGREKHHTLPGELDHAGGQGKDPLTLGVIHRRKRCALSSLQRIQNSLENERPKQTHKEPKRSVSCIKIAFKCWALGYFLQCLAACCVSVRPHFDFFFQKRHKSRRGLGTCGLDFTGFSRAEWAWRFSLKSGFTQRRTQIIGAGSGRLYHSYTEVLRQIGRGGVERAIGIACK